MDGSVIFVIILAIGAFINSIREEKLYKFKTNKKDYMNSNEWKIMREKILYRDNYRCVVCSTEENLDIHHITYERVGNEYR